MKQIFLFSFCLLAIAGFLQAQTSSSGHLINQPLRLNRMVKYDHSLFSKNSEQLSFSSGKQTPAITSRTAGETPGSIVIGTTYYDLQTGLSVARRVLRRSDGTMSCVWTGSPDAAFAQRGTEYAYFDGTSWTCINPTTRLEPIRTGWPNIGMLNGKEFIICHNGANYSLEQGTSGGIGQCSPSDWNFTLSGATVPIRDTGAIWPRMAIDGNNIVTVAVFAASTDTLAGVSGPVVYGRSTDGGLTWSPNNTFPGYNNDKNGNTTQDQYDIDENGGKMSVVDGFLGNDLDMWNSTDGGATWTETAIDTLPPFSTWPEDTLFDTNDGTMSVVIDNNGKTHVAYGLGVAVKVNNAGTDQQDLIIGALGLRYWEEGMSAPSWVVNPDSLPIVFDANGDGQYSVGVLGTLSNAQGATDTYGRFTGTNASLLTEPSISYDTLGDVFVTFMLAHDADTTFDGQTYHNIYLASHKAGDPWSASNWNIQDITPTFFVENAFGTTARMTTDSIRMEYQEDDIPGTYVNNAVTASAMSNINYLAVANPYFVTGIKNVQAIKGIDVQQNFPNPFNKQSVIQIKMDRAQTITFQVTDVLGKVVMQQTMNYSGGTHNITINRDQLSSGIYFYSVQAGNQQVTNKMVVE